MKSSMENRGSSSSQDRLGVPSSTLHPDILVVVAVVCTPVTLVTVHNCNFTPLAIYVIEPNWSGAFGKSIEQINKQKSVG